MSVAVNIVVKDNQPSPAPIAGVAVGVYDPTAFAFVAYGVTDSGGQAAFLLPGAASPGRTYEVRFYKMGIVFPNPSQIQVLETSLGSGSGLSGAIGPANANQQTNIFTATGVPSVLPVATDPRCCRCTGVFLDFSNRPVRGMLVRFYPNPEPGFEVPKVVDGNLVAAESFEIYTDANGRVSLDLIRGGQYNVMFAGEEDNPWNIKIPDRSSMNLIDLIHPAPVSLTWDPGMAPGNAVHLAIGQSVKVPFTVLFSDFETNVALDKWLNITFPDAAPFSAQFEITKNGVTLNLTGRSAGTAAVTVGLQSDLFPKRVPDYSLIAPVLNVTVS